MNKYTYEQVASKTNLSISTIKSKTVDKDYYKSYEQFERVGTNYITIKSVENYVYYSIYLKKYQTYKNNIYRKGLLPHVFIDWLMGSKEPLKYKPIDYLYYKEALKWLDCSETTFQYHINVKKVFKIYSINYQDLFLIDDIIKFKHRNLSQNLILCKSCNCKKNYTYFTMNAGSDLICDICLQKEMQNKNRLKKDKLKNQKQQEKIKQKKVKNLMSIARAARKEKLKNELKEKIDYINKKYGSTICEINNYYFIEKKQETLKVLEYCNSILRKRNSKYIKSLKEKATLRLEQLKEQDLRDYDMSITGYKFDF